MEQRIYHATNVSPEALADYLIQNTELPGRRRHWLVQKIGGADSVIVQIGRDHHYKVEPAVSLAIARIPDHPGDIAVTMGEKEWLTADKVTHGAMMGAIALVSLSPWVLLHPARHMLEGEMLPGQLWDNIDLFILGQGGTVVQRQNLNAPQA